MSAMSNLKVSYKLLASFGAIFLVVVAFCTIALFSLSVIKSATVQNAQAQEITKLSTDILSALVEQQNAMRGYVASTEEEFFGLTAKYGALVPPLLQTLETKLGQDAAKEYLPPLREAIAKREGEVQDILAGVKDPTRLEAIRKKIGSTARLTKVREILGNLAAQQKTLADKRTAELSSAFERGTVTLVAGGVLTGAIALIMGYLLARGLGRPIVAMTSAMGKLANGNTEIIVPMVGRRDEIGEMAAAVEVFRVNATDRIRLEAEAAANRNLADQERQRKADADRARAEEMAQASAALGEGLKHLASGDLTFQLTTPFAADFETIRSDFNAAVSQLSETLRGVAESTTGLDTGSREVSSSANDLSKRTEQQAASLEETAAALDQITVNVANSSRRADEARKVAMLANETAAQSGKVVANAVDAMQKIEQSSNEISSIIGVIDEIAFQTNLLALNAGVEAARAGEAGKGFAVVAQEVRELAQRSAKAAKDIKDLIRNSSTDVQNGVKLVSDTGQVLKTIEGYIVTVNQHMDAIATSAKEQSAGLAEVNTAVNRMDQVTQQNAAMVEETSAAGATLANESGKLRELVSQFQLGGVLRQTSAMIAAGSAQRSMQSPGLRYAS